MGELPWAKFFGVHYIGKGCQIIKGSGVGGEFSGVHNGF